MITCWVFNIFLNVVQLKSHWTQYSSTAIFSLLNAFLIASFSAKHNLWLFFLQFRFSKGVMKAACLRVRASSFISSVKDSLHILPLVFNSEHLFLIFSPQSSSIMSSPTSFQSLPFKSALISMLAWFFSCGARHLFGFFLSWYLLGEVTSFPNKLFIWLSISLLDCYFTLGVTT